MVFNYSFHVTLLHLLFDMLYHTYDLNDYLNRIFYMVFLIKILTYVLIMIFFVFYFLYLYIYKYKYKLDILCNYMKYFNKLIIILIENKTINKYY